MINGCVNDALVSCWVIINDILKTDFLFILIKKETKKKKIIAVNWFDVEKLL